MTVGSLGDIVFCTSSSTVRTLTDINKKISVSYGSHKIHGAKSKLEHTGSEPDSISFTIELSAFLGVNPSSAMDELEEMAEAGAAVSFILGTRVYGSGLWVIDSLSEAFDMVYKDGSVLTASVKVSLKEYVE